MQLDQKNFYFYYAKKGIDYTKYGFADEGKEWVVWENTRRITIKKSNMLMSFNMVYSKILKIFMDMVLDNVIIVKKYKEHGPRKHYINLTDEEYQIIKKRRA